MVRAGVERVWVVLKERQRHGVGVRESLTPGTISPSAVSRRRFPMSRRTNEVRRQGPLEHNGSPAPVLTAAQFSRMSVEKKTPPPVIVPAKRSTADSRQVHRHRELSARYLQGSCHPSIGGAIDPTPEHPTKRQVSSTVNRRLHRRTTQLSPPSSSHPGPCSETPLPLRSRQKGCLP